MTRPKALLVVDYSPTSGLGHLRRAAAIAAALSNLGWDARFARTGNAELPLPETGTVADREEAVPPDEIGASRPEFSACVVDSYELDEEQRQTLAPYLEIDDFYLPAPGAIAVVNPAPGADPSRYDGYAMHFTGAQYALLGVDVREIRATQPAFPPRQVLISLGAGSTNDLVDTAEAAVAEALPDATVSSIGSRAPDAKGIAPLIASADIVICAGGVTALEVAALGRPAVGLLLAENQRANIEGLAAAGTLIEAEPTMASIASAIRQLTSSRDEFEAVSYRGREVVDGLGAERVAGEIQRLFAGDLARTELK